MTAPSPGAAPAPHAYAVGRSPAWGVRETIYPATWPDSGSPTNRSARAPSKARGRSMTGAAPRPETSARGRLPVLAIAAPGRSRGGERAATVGMVGVDSRAFALP